MKDKRNIIIIVIVLLIIILGIYLIIKKNKLDFHLIGEETMMVRYGTKYIDPGVVAKDGFGNDISDSVNVYGVVNPLILGTYRIVYEIDYHGIKTIERLVVVQNIPIEDLEIRLNGEENVGILKDNAYVEEGAYIYNTVDEFVMDNESLNILSDVDTNKVGKYKVDYVLNYDGKTITKTRNVEVFDINYSITPEELTSNKVVINIDLSSISNYLNTKLPDNSISDNKSIKYEVNSNGEYEFVVSLTNNKTFTKKITIDNIIGNYTCKGEITSIGTKLSVSPTNDIKEYKWITNNGIVSGNSLFNANYAINNAMVELVFEGNRTYKVNCSIEDKLLYHFKYDEKNTKPFMRKDTYTSADKIRLDNLLKQVVAEAGYGTRAGVVAAARFLVGGLDYKVPYQGASYYRQVGLNIGQNNAWGSSGVGLDCYSFVLWARIQNGLKDDSFYAGVKKNTVDEANNIRVGDYLLTPCSGTCKNPFKINHIALVIGVTDKYIYVAEEKTVDINALVVTKLDKSNLPKRYSLSLVRHVDYPSEGNVTNMWME